MDRMVICPACGTAVTFSSDVCPKCREVLRLHANDHQSMEFTGVSDGYHCWNAHPTAYHNRYVCLTHPDCTDCVHQNVMFCRNGIVDIRIARTEQGDTILYQWDHGTKPYSLEKRTGRRRE